MVKRDAGKRVLKIIGGALGLLAFAGLIAFAANGWWGLLAGAGVPCGLILLGVLIHQGWESVTKSGMTYISATIVEQSLKPVTKAGFRCKEHDELPKGVAPSGRDFETICARMKVDPETALDGILLDTEWRCYYSDVDRVYLDVADELELAENLGEVDEVKIAGSAGFDVRRVKVILWLVRGAWEDRMRPRLLPDHGLFGFVDQRRMQVECQLILLREIRPGVVILQVEHVLQETYDVSFKEKALENPDNAIVEVVCRYNSHLAEAPAHAKAVLQDVELDRDWWMGKAVRAEDEKNAYREEHEGDSEDETPAQPDLAMSQPEQRWGAGIGLGIVLGILSTLVVLVGFLHVVL